MLLLELLRVQFAVPIYTGMMGKPHKNSFIVSDRIGIDEVPEIYREFDKRDKVVKPVIKF